MARQIADYRKVPIKKIPIFRDLSSESIKKIEDKAVRLTFTKGRDIVSKSDDSDDVFVLLSGIARVIIFSSSGRAVSFRYINPGDFFGEFAAIDGRRRSATVDAVKPCTALCLTSALFWNLMENDRAFVAVVLNRLVDLLRSATLRIVEFSTLAVKNRIHCEVLRMAKASTEGAGGERLINPAPTHQEIAARISTHREAVAREFSQMRKAGLIERRGRQLAVKDLVRLEQMVQDAYGEDWTGSEWKDCGGSG
jgi:CRP/FNR family transcriptional regulator, cyclic AMP receptor protein